MVNPVLI